MKRILTLTFLMLLTIPSLVSGAVPRTMSYQGILEDAGGAVVADGYYQLEFSLHPAAIGGLVLWSETQTLYVEDGLFNAILGQVTALPGIDFDAPYWLGIGVDGGAQLTPRVTLTASPYSLNSDRLDGLTSTYFATATHTHTLGALADVNTTGATDGEVLTYQSGSNTWVPSAVGAGGDDDWTINGDDVYHYPGRVGIGTPPTELLTVGGTTLTGGFKMPTGAGNGYVLTSNSSGTGTWQPVPGGGVDGAGTSNFIARWLDSNTLTSSVLVQSGLRIGVGIVSPIDAKLDVYSEDNEIALDVVSTYSGTLGRVMNVERTVAPAALNDLLQIKAPAGSPDGFQFIECERGTDVEFSVDGNGEAYFAGQVGIGVTMPTYKLDVESPEDCIRAMNTGSVLSDYIAVDGNSRPADYYGIGGRFVGGYHGVEGRVSPTGFADYYGVYGYVSGGSGTNRGVYGYAGGGATNYAGYFSGSVHVNGLLTKAGGSFKIDHPLDPSHRYLSHSFVESPDMMNVYNGNAILGADGEAWIEMPDWFEALNRDFRYQLTCIGGFAPVYVATEIDGNRFRIAGGEAGLKVSWQVTGIRHDEWANQNRIPVEEYKPAGEQGTYLHPAAHGLPEALAVDYEARLGGKPGERADEARPASSGSRKRGGDDGAR